MNQDSFPKRWYLELDEKRMGPFSPEQILGLLAEGEIPAGLVVSPAGAGSNPDAKMTAAELRQAYFRENRIPTAPHPAEEPTASLADTLPDAPPESASLEPANELATNRRLFDLFQTAKEKRAARFAPDLKAASRTRTPSDSLRTPVSIAATVAVVLITGFFGIRGLRNSSDEAGGIDRELAQVAPAPPISSASSSSASKGEVPKPVIKNAWKPPIRSAPPVVRTAPRPAPQLQSRPHSDSRNDDPRQDDNRGELSSANLVNQMANDSGIAPGSEAPANPENAPALNDNPDGQPAGDGPPSDQ